MRLIILLACLAATACSNPTPELKSPCVSATDGPCDRRAPADQGMS